VVSGVCLLAGVLFGTAHAYSDGQDIRPRNVELSSLIIDAQARLDAAATTAQVLQSQIDTAAGQNVSPQVAEVRASADALSTSAGLTAVTVPGISVTLTDAPRDSDGNYPADANPDDLVVHQQDVQAVVNALWAGGAEAMMIMDQRVIATSAVRCIGNTLLLMGRAYSPPFVITAIGPADPMVAAMEVQPGVTLFRQYVDRFNLGFEIEIVDSLSVPGYDGLVRMTAAQEVPR
jgi:uncharacterized protein YlxW (UPF0749 family)